MLIIKSLRVKTDGKEILKGLNLTVGKGEIHAIMGPNGSGKSTFAKVLAGHPSYEIVEGSIEFNGKDLIELEPEERAHVGLFMSFQYPIEIPGITNIQFLQTAVNSTRKAQGEKEFSEQEFEKVMSDTMKAMNIPEEFKARHVNMGFSGGEKKRNEILQMAILDPKFSILDETDSGLDIDALRLVAEGVNHLMNKEKGLILITHYQRLLDYIKPDKVHVMFDGRIIESGGAELALKLEEKGYDWLVPSKEELV